MRKSHEEGYPMPQSELDKLDQVKTTSQLKARHKLQFAPQNFNEGVKMQVSYAKLDKKVKRLIGFRKAPCGVHGYVALGIKGSRVDKVAMLDLCRNHCPEMECLCLAG